MNKNCVALICKTDSDIWWVTEEEAEKLLDYETVFKAEDFYRQKAAEYEKKMNEIYTEKIKRYGLQLEDIK